MSKISDLRRQAADAKKAGRWAEAVKLYERICSLDGSNPTHRNELGDVYVKQGNIPEALEAFTKAIELYTAVGLSNNAVAVHKKILRYDANHLDSHWGLGELRRRQGLESEAVASFLEFLQRGDQVPAESREAFLDRCSLLLETMADDLMILSALEELYERWDLSQEQARILLCKACLAREQGHDETADHYLTRARELADDVESLPEYQELVPGAADVDPAEVMAAPPPDAENPAVAVGVGTAASDVTPAAGEEATDGAEAVDVDDEVASFAAELADVLDLDEEGSSADQDQEAPAPDAGSGAPAEPAATPPEPQEAAAPSPPQDKAAPPQPEEVATPAKDPEAAPPEPQEAVASSQGSGTAPLKPKEAAEETSDGGGLEAILSDGEVDLKREQQRQVETIVQDLEGQMGANVDADDPLGQYNLGVVYMDMALYDQAISAFARAADSEELRLKALEMKGNCLAKLGRWDEALDTYREGLSFAGYSARAYLGLLYGLGAGLEELGRPDEAIPYYERVALVDHGFLDVRERLERLQGASS